MRAAERARATLGTRQAAVSAQLRGLGGVGGCEDTGALRARLAAWVGAFASAGPREGDVRHVGHFCVGALEAGRLEVVSAVLDWWGRLVRALPAEAEAGAEAWRRARATVEAEVGAWAETHLGAQLRMGVG